MSAGLRHSVAGQGFQISEETGVHVRDLDKRKRQSLHRLTVAQRHVRDVPNIDLGSRCRDLKVFHSAEHVSLVVRYRSRKLSGPAAILQGI
jgi:hypothetical protein